MSPMRLLASSFASARQMARAAVGACLLAAALLVGAALPAGAQLPVPELSGRVIDQTGTLNAAQRSALESKLAGFEAQAGPQIVVLLVPTTAPEDIAAYAQRVADQWKIGRRDQGDGLLLVVAKNDRRVRIEVAKALEGAVPDLAARQIIDNLPRIVPAGNSDAINQVRDMQDEVRGRKSDREEESPDQAPAVVVPMIAARPDTGPITRKEDGSVEVVMPDVEATIEAITARTTDPNRNPNVARDDGADAGKKDDNGRKQPTPTAGSKKKNDRNRGRQTPTPRPGIVPATENRDNNNNGSNQGNDKQCDNPFANLPKDQQPKNWPFDDC